MIDNSSRVSDSLLSRRIRQMVRLDPGAPALFYGDAAFTWAFYADAVTSLLTGDQPAAEWKPFTPERLHSPEKTTHQGS